MGVSKQRRKLHKDNRGSGLIMVLIMVAFLSILAAVLMFAAYGGYRMRMEDRQGKDNFYTAETVLDEINVGLQKEVSAALSKAYQEVMVNYSLYETPAKRGEKLYEIYYKELQKSLQLDDLHTSLYSVEKLQGYLSPELCGDGKNGIPADGSKANFGSYGAIVESTQDPDVYTLALKSDGIVLKDLKVSYVNQRGYVSIITTDIRIALPRVNFSQSATFPDLNQYCLIADQGLYAGNTNPAGSISFYGNVYAESMQLGEQTVDGTNFLAGRPVSFEAPWKDAPALSGENEPSLVVCKEAMDVTKTDVKTNENEVWCQDIILNSAKIYLEGETYVQNDLKLEGTGSSVTLAGSYTGFGTSLGTPDQSSAIVVNGRDSSLDLSGLKSLNLGGHTYVATAGTQQMSGVHDSNDEVKDILMGESVAVKSNQLIYLVPPEALGCEILEDGVTVGESVFRSNPMKLEQYQEIKNNPDKYVLLDGNRRIAALGYKPLSDYMNQQSLSGGGAEYRPTVIVRPTNAGSLVYCYMQFKDEAAANQYFRDYYGVNAETVDKFTRIYADAIKMPSDTDAMLYLHLAGNVLAYEEDSAASVVDATDDYSEKMKAQELSVIRSETFRALTTKMVSNLAQLSMTEQGRTVFENIVNEDGVRTLVNFFRANPVDNQVILSTEDGSQSVLLSLNDYEINSSTADNIHMVVALGDVKVKKDFKGVILSGGRVIVSDENDFDGKVELKSLSLEEFTELLKIKNTRAEDGKDYYVLSIFWDGVNYVYDTNTVMDYGTKEVSIADLIVYERWSKK